MQSTQQDYQRQLPPLPTNSNQNNQPTNGANYQSPPLNQTPSLRLYGSQIPLNQSQQQSMASLQPMESSELVITQSLPNQTFPIIYNDAIYMVDPEGLSNSSLKFKELIDPFMKDNKQLNNVRIQVVGNSFTNRNMENFLKLCQGLPTDVQNDEMKEICEIAKMFLAEQIYNTGVKFIQSAIDPNFFVPDNKYDGSDGITHIFAELERKDQEQPEEKTTEENLIQENPVHERQDDIAVDDNLIQNQANTESKNEEPNENIEQSVIYEVGIESRGLKCTVYRFFSKGNLMFSAKKKDFNIFIVEGDDVHINRNKSNHIGHIHQYPDGFNMIKAGDSKYKLSYVDSGKPNEVSIKISFPFKDEIISWEPKTPKYNAASDQYYLNFSGNSHHTPMKSSRNIVLQNTNGHATFIARKMNPKLFELECHPAVDPLIAFTIGLSDIVGPYSN